MSKSLISLLRRSSALGAAVLLAGCSAVGGSSPTSVAECKPVTIIDDGLEFGEYRFDSDRHFLPTYCNRKTGRCFKHNEEQALTIIEALRSGRKPFVGGI